MAVKPSQLPFVRPAGFGVLALAAAFAFGTGCEKEDNTIRVYSAPKEQQASAGQAAQAAIEWSVPEGWEKQPPRNMVFAAFKVSKDDPKAECTVTTFPMQLDAAPALLLNVNRWEKQVNLPPSAESDLPKVVKDVELPAGKARLVDLTGPEPAGADGGTKQHLIVYLLPHGGATWFLKLTGSVAAVDAQKANFEAFAKSVKFPAAGGNPTATADASAGSGGGGDSTGTPATGTPDVPPQTDEPPQKLSKWTTPGGWKQDEKQSQFRDLSFQVSADDKPGEKAEVSVARLPGDNLEVLGQDVNMWRGQVGLEPLNVTKFNDLGVKRVDIGGRPCALFETAGPQADKPEKRVVVVMVPRGGELWFFKIAGSAGLVEAQKPVFMSFVNSTQFAAK